MKNKFSAILNFTELNSKFLNALTCLMNQPLRDIEIIIVFDSSDNQGISELKNILGKNSEIKFYEQKQKKNILNDIDGECLIFCDESNILKAGAFAKIYDLYEDNDKDVLIFNPKNLSKSKSDIFKYSDLNISNFLFRTEFIKNNFDITDLSSPATLLKIIATAEIKTVNYNPFLEYASCIENKFMNRKEALISLDEAYDFIIENNLEDRYLKDFSNFFLKYVYHLFFFCDINKEETVKFMTGKIRSFFKIIKSTSCPVQYKIFQKYFLQKKKNAVINFSNEINVALCCDEESTPFVALSLISLIEKTDKNAMYDIYILHNGLSSGAMKNLLSLSADNINILFVNISDYSNKFGADFGDAELIIPEIFRNFEKIIYLKNSMLLKFDIAELYEKSFSADYILGISNNDTKDDLKDIVIFVFDIKKCLKDKISEQMFLFCRQGIDTDAYLKNYITIFNQKYDFVYLNHNAVNNDNINSSVAIEWLNFARNTPFYEGFFYKLFEKAIQND